VLLIARLRYGKISYQNGDVLEQKDRWQPSDRQEANLIQDYESAPEAVVRFISNGNGGVLYDVTVKRAPGRFTWMWNCLLLCLTWMWNCLLGCFTWFWNWLSGFG